MFQKEHLEEYRNIKAPAELKERVLADCKNPFRQSSKKNSLRLYRTLSSLAACLVLVIGVLVGTYIGIPAPSAEYDQSFAGTPLPLSILTDAPIQKSTAIAIPLKLGGSGMAKIEISSGTLYALDEKGEYAEIKDEIKLDGENLAVWYVTDTAEKCELKIKCRFKASTYYLDFAENGDVTINKK